MLVKVQVDVTWHSFSLHLVAARVDRMKEAKIEADQIIAAYRAEMEAVYQKSLATVSACI